MITLRIKMEKEVGCITEEVIGNVYDFTFDFITGSLIIKCLDDERAVLKMLSINCIKEVIGYEID